jgi:hypothetical protein
MISSPAFAGLRPADTFPEFKATLEGIGAQYLLWIEGRKVTIAGRAQCRFQAFVEPEEDHNPP